jgi:predicted ATP-grasp superfamily ATP-dependent carboligase
LNEVHLLTDEFRQKLGSSQDIIIQEYIQGVGCAYFALVDDGKIIMEFGHIRVRENPPSGGASTSCDRYYNEKLFAYGRTLLQHTNYNGLVMVECKYNAAKDDFWLIEVNPKLWGSLLLSIVSGVDFPLAYVKHLQGQAISATAFSPQTIQFLVPDLRRALKFKQDLGATIKAIFNPAITKDIFYLGLLRYVKFSFGKFICK